VATSSVPLTIALAAGGLSVVNPCGFPLLPAFLSFYLAADEEQLPRARTRALQGIAVGGFVTIGFLGLFALVGLPVTYGVGAIAGAVPWVGLATGVVLALVGLAGLFGRHVGLRAPGRLLCQTGRGAGAMILFGVAYGAASLGCTLPLFLTLVATSLGGAKLGAFIAYGVGMAAVLMALSIGIALLRAGAVRAVRGGLRYVAVIANVLLIASGCYLAYYWARIKFGDTATLADDPIVSFGIRFSGHIRILARDHSTVIVIGAGIIVLVAAASALRLRHRAAPADSATAP
jgi:cytochrome c-type biogenesis protein